MIIELILVINIIFIILLIIFKKLINQKFKINIIFIFFIFI